MAGKKKIQKAPKPNKGKKEEQDSKVPQKEQVPPQQEPIPQKIESTEDKIEREPPCLNFISESFYCKIDHFKQFYSEFLGVKNGGDEEILEVNKRVSSQLENACSIVLKEDLKEAEKWLSQQQQGIQNQIKSTNQALEATKNALAGTKSFSPQQINQQVKCIEEKKEKLGNMLERYEQLKDKARKIYSSEEIEEK